MTDEMRMKARFTKAILKEWRKYDRLNVQMDSEEEATQLATACVEAMPKTRPEAPPAKDSYEYHTWQPDQKLSAPKGVNIEPICAAVHEAYCRYCVDIKKEPYWTNGDYSKLPESQKKADRYTVRAVLKYLGIEEESRGGV